MKGHVQERALDFWPFSKCSKIAEFWHVGFVLPEKHIYQLMYNKYNYCNNCNNCNLEAKVLNPENVMTRSS